MSTMKAVVFKENLPISDPASLQDESIPAPAAPKGRDLLVRVSAIGVNPVDFKVRKGALGPADGKPHVLGWDAAGTVEAVGPDCTLFKVGDEIYYAGDVTKPGCNSEKHVVDERIVGRKPKNLSWPEAAAIPLTALTAGEALFARLQLDRTGGGDKGKSLLIINGAGGVGSIAIQLAKRAGLRVLATASRAESQKWVKELGADDVVDHSQDIVPQVEALMKDNGGFVDFIANFADTDKYWDAQAKLIAPQGKIVSIVETKHPVDLEALKAKSALFVWEFMFTASMFKTRDMQKQHDILNTVSDMCEAGELKGTMKEHMQPINAENLRKAHAASEAGSAVGKMVLSGWQKE